MDTFAPYMQIMEYPILMADIIKSRKGNSKEILLDFKKLVGFINLKWAKSIVSPLTITLGDEFQGVINSTQNAFQIIIAMEEEIIKNNYAIKLRYVLHVGEIETQINKSSAYEMLGEGLTTARKSLNELKKSKRRFLVSSNKNSESLDIINDLFKLLESFIDSWKSKEYVIVSAFLLNKSYKEIAENLNMNISSSWRRKKSLNMEEYAICKKLILKINDLVND